MSSLRTLTLLSGTEKGDFYVATGITFTPESISLVNCEIYQRGKESRVADTELILLIAHLIRPPCSIPGEG